MKIVKTVLKYYKTSIFCNLRIYYAKDYADHFTTFQYERCVCYHNLNLNSHHKQGSLVQISKGEKYHSVKKKTATKP